MGVAVLLKQNPSLHPNWPLPGPSSSLQVGPGVGASWGVTRAAVGLGGCESGGEESCEQRRALGSGLSVQPWVRARVRVCVDKHEGLCSRGVRACTGCVCECAQPQLRPPASPGSRGGGSPGCRLPPRGTLSSGLEPGAHSAWDAWPHPILEPHEESAELC